MKNNLLKGMLFIVLAGLITFTGCKYEDGPGISLRSKRDRFSNEWIVKSYDRLLDGQKTAENLSNRFGDDSTTLGNVVFITTRTGAFSITQFPTTPYAFDSVVWTKPVYLQMKQLTANLSEALGMVTSYTNDTNEFAAPVGKWTFNDKSNSVLLERDLAHIDSIPHVSYEILELREDALKLKFTDAVKTTRTIGFTPINDEDFFL